MRRLAVRLLALAACGAAVLLGGCAAGGRQLAAVPQDGTYCYRTLARPDCYTRPVPQDRDRLLGYQGPPPGPPPARAVIGARLDPPPPPVRSRRRDGIDSISR